MLLSPLSLERDNSSVSISKTTPPRLQCPFCATTSARGTGLSSHIRSQHPREYAKWNKNPNKLVDAASPAKVSGKTSRTNAVVPMPGDVAAEATRPPKAKSSRKPAPLAIQHVDPDGGGNSARDLVQKAYEQLSARKQSIEAELARIEALRSEHAAVTAQVAALDEAMTAFSQQGKR
jgi:hypothetical protein